MANESLLEFHNESCKILDLLACILNARPGSVRHGSFYTTLDEINMEQTDRIENPWKSLGKILEQ
jgi:hypothetical protein